MNGKWTYSDLDIEWVNEIFETREEAIEEAKRRCEVGSVIGRTETYLDVNGVQKCRVVNQEKMIWN